MEDLVFFTSGFVVINLGLLSHQQVWCGYNWIAARTLLTP